MKLIRLALLATPLLAGCLANIEIPLDRDLDRTELGSKTGESSFTIILWLFAWGDAGTQAAAKQGGLTTITHADQRFEVVLFGLYAKNTTIVYGN